MQPPENGRICGEVIHIRFENSITGFAVITLNADDGSRHTLCGNLAGLNIGDMIEAEGYFEDNEKFGKQFHAETFRPVLPETAEGIKKYLITQIDGIGPKTASLIVSAFGCKTVKILDNYPARLKEIKGIGPKKADMVIEAWKEGRAKRSSMIFLQGLGISPAYCAKLFREYGDRAPQIVKNNPFRLAEDIDGIGFLKADMIAAQLGFEKDSIERSAAGVLYILNLATASGNCGLPAEDLLRKTCDLLKQTPDVIKQGIEHALIRNFIVACDDFFTTPKLHRAETEIPVLLKKLMATGNHPGKKLTSEASRFQWAECQKKAVQEVTKSPLSIITGGPGVGKTTVIKEIVERAKKAGISFVLTSPTGRAAKRMSQTTGVDAKTIHRLLMYDPARNAFSYDENNPLQYDMVIADEVSMLDITLAHALFKAIAPGTTVVLVGDADQLPPVGPGCFFSDLIASGKVPVTKLDQVFRQSSGSHIIEAAHSVNAGVLPRRYDSPESDFFWIRQDDPEKVMDMIKKLVTERIPEKFGFDPEEDIQILTPMNRGVCGTDNINKLLCDTLNPGKEDSTLQMGEKSIKPGDKVMQIKNNYDKNVFNGDFGTVISTDSVNGKFQIQFDGQRVVEYFSDEMGQITKAYAITVHKSQGSEFPAVIILLMNQHFLMLQRNLLYTAMTRAKNLLILIGGEQSIQMAVRNIRKEQRFTKLPEYLKSL